MIHPTAIVHPGAKLGPGVSVGAYSIIGAEVELGEGTQVGPHVVVDGRTRIGADNRIFPFCSLGAAPQDKKYAGEPTALEIGDRNTIREFCTFNCGTAQDAGVTRLGSDNWIMAYVHIAHDCHVGNDTIFGNMATLGGHVTVEDFANVSAGSGVHQFCRVGRHAFIGGYSVVTKDALPFARTVGSRPARIYGLNIIGLMRRGFSPEVLAKLKGAFRYLLQSKLNTTSALQHIQQDRSLTCAEVQYLLEFIRSSQRGVILRRAPRRTEEVFAEE